MGDYRELRVWREAHELTLAVYRVSAAFPSAELYGLTSQLRRAAASVPANLAEGTGRRSDREMVRFSKIALGSANELEYHLLLARDLGLLQPAVHLRLAKRVQSVKSMLARLIETLRAPRDRRP